MPDPFKNGFLNARENPASLGDTKALNEGHHHLSVQNIKETLEREPIGTIYLISQSHQRNLTCSERELLA